MPYSFLLAPTGPGVILDISFTSFGNCYETKASKCPDSFLSNFSLCHNLANQLLTGHNLMDKSDPLTCKEETNFGIAMNKGGGGPATPQIFVDRFGVFDKCFIIHQTVVPE